MFMSYADFERGIPSARLQKQRQEAAAKARRDDLYARFCESERILGILRSIKPECVEVTPEAMSTWYESIETDDWVGSPAVESPSLWFNLKFPTEAERFGNAFLEEKTEHGQCRPLFANVDFLAAILGGEKGLGHQVVYSSDEGTFYFRDPVLDAFVPTTLAKIQLLASNYLVKCAEAFGNKVTILPLLDDFRRVNVLQAITSRAKVILEADKSFFHGPQGQIRCIDGYRLDPTSEAPHRLFVQKVMVRLPGARITVSEAYSHYARFCRTNHLPTLKMVDFKTEVAAAIHEVFNLRPRHDLPGEDGKATHGWLDLACTFE